MYLRIIIFKQLLSYPISNADSVIFFLIHFRKNFNPLVSEARTLHPGISIIYILDGDV